MHCLINYWLMAHFKNELKQLAQTETSNTCTMQTGSMWPVTGTDNCIMETGSIHPVNTL